MSSIMKLRIFMEFCLLLSLQSSDSSTIPSLIFVVSSSFHFGKDRQLNFCRSTDFSKLIHPFLFLHHINLFSPVPPSWIPIQHLGCEYPNGEKTCEVLSRFGPSSGTEDRIPVPCVPPAPSIASWTSNFPPVLCHQILLWNQKFKTTPSVVEMGVRPSD